MPICALHCFLPIQGGAGGAGGGGGDGGEAEGDDGRGVYDLVGFVSHMVKKYRDT